jgi:hypothetical protein
MYPTVPMCSHHLPLFRTRISVLALDAVIGKSLLNAIVATSREQDNFVQKYPAYSIVPS